MRFKSRTITPGVLVMIGMWKLAKRNKIAMQTKNASEKFKGMYPKRDRLFSAYT